MKRAKATAYLIRQDRIRNTQMPATWKGVLLVLHFYSNDKHRCFPSHRTIAKESCFNRRTVQYTLDAMAEAGIITRRKRWVEGPVKMMRRSDEVTIKLAALAQLTPKWWRSRTATVAALRSTEVTIEESISRNPSVVPFRPNRQVQQ